MDEDLLHEPEVLYWFRHVSGDLDVAISLGGDKGWRMTLLPDTKEVRKLIKKKVLSATDTERVAKLTAGTKIGTSDYCCVEDCNNPSSGTDRGKPLCESCWNVHSIQTETMAEDHYDPPEVKFEDKDPYGLLFG
jgi:hypothetical protein